MKFNSLVEIYQIENRNFYFSTPKYEILAKNILVEIPFSCAGDIPEIVAKMRDRGEVKDKLIVGAIPFDVNEGGKLYLVDVWEKKDISFKDKTRSFKRTEMNNQVISKEFIPSKERYMEMVEKGIAYIKSGLLNKLVLSRGVKLQFQHRLDVFQILQRLWQENLEGYTYALPLEGETFLIGASPEMVVSKKGNYIYSNPLAGSRARGKSKEEDMDLAEELKRSAKDLKEHKIVVDNVAEKMWRICKTVRVPEEPRVINTKQLWHLSSIVEGKMTSSDKTVLDAVLTLHPTPAICGVPENKAYEKILELERGSRGLFTGVVGWCDENGDGDWAIAIRGAEVNGSEIFIRAGAGIVRDSIPKEELKETGAKFRTMLNGIDLVRRQARGSVYHEYE